MAGELRVCDVTHGRIVVEERMRRYRCKACGKGVYMSEDSERVYHERPTCEAFEERMKGLKGEYDASFHLFTSDTCTVYRSVGGDGPRVCRFG